MTAPQSNADNPDGAEGDAARCEDPLWGFVSPGEHRWPTALTIVVVIAFQLSLPSKLTLGPDWMMPLIEGAVLATLLVVGPIRLDARSRDVRWISLTLIGILSAANAFTLGLLIHHLLKPGDLTDGRTLVFSAFTVWATAVLSFGLWYWELDRGGPVQRCFPDHGPPDFLFPQMENPSVTKQRWTPIFVDYLYLSFTNSTAFSPTDTMPLTGRAKLLMGVQATSALIVSILVIARGVGVLQ